MKIIAMKTWKKVSILFVPEIKPANFSQKIFIVIILLYNLECNFIKM